MVLEFGLGFIDRLTGAKTTAYTHLEDLADRLNHFISCVIILMLSGVTMANVYFLRPISCTLPTSPDNKFNEFAESVCWVRGTIAIRENDQMPLTDEDWNQLRDKADMCYHGNLYHFGNQLILTLKSKHEWIESEFFPRQTYCPIQVRHLGTKNNLFTAICALPVNMFNEKIYIFLWLWILFVTMITMISIIIWLIRFIIKNCQTTYIQHYLVVSIQSQLLDKYFNHSFNCDGCNIQLNDIRIHQFIKKFIKNDGYFLIHMLRDNIGDIITGEILNQWWHMFIDYHKAYLNREKQLKQNENNNNNNKEKQYDYMNITLDNDTILNPNSDQSNGNFV
ncbi:unnamed protein product [Schistosoma bovis]|nr:unnamed protein product [Schistosoma bovis]